MTEARRVFSDELERLLQDVVRLGELALESIQRGSEALLTRDVGAVDKIVLHDRLLDQFSDSIEERIYLVLATQAPVATDLRQMLTMLRVGHELERVGDHMVTIAKAGRQLPVESLDPRILGILDRMRDQAAAQLVLALDAFAQRDPSEGAVLPAVDDVMDELTRELFRTIATLEPDDESLRCAVELAVVGRCYERIADHAVVVGERVDYMVTGRFRERRDIEPWS